MKWISVKDSLPEISYRQLLVKTREFPDFYLRYFDVSKQKWIAHEAYDYDYYPDGYITHWMQIPTFDHDDIQEQE